MGRKHFYFATVFLIILAGSTMVASAESSEYGRNVNSNELIYNTSEAIVGAWIWDRDSEDDERFRTPMIYYFKEDGTCVTMWWPGDNNYEDFDNSKAKTYNSYSWEEYDNGIHVYAPTVTGIYHDFRSIYEINGHTVIETNHQDGSPCELIAITDTAYNDFKDYIALDWETFDYDTLKNIKDDLIYEVEQSIPTEYNPELAYKLMLAANAAYKQKSDVKKYLNKVGVNNVESYNYYGNPFDSRYESDSVAFSIGCNYTDDCKIVTIVIRGSYGDLNDMTPDWQSNLNIDAGMEAWGFTGWHSGFSNASKKVYDKLVSEGLLDTNNTKYVITGHSRGAGVGNLLAIRLSDAGVAKDNVFDYNFACPDVNRGWPSDWNRFGAHDNVFNINYCGDPVTMIPGVLMDFNIGALGGIAWGKYGRSVWYADNWNNFETADWSFNSHLQDNYIRFLKKRKPFDYYRTWDQMNFKQFENQIVGTISGFFCPIDVIAKDKNGKVIASVINNDVSYTKENDGRVLVITTGDKKWFYAQKGFDVTYELAGSDAGTMTNVIYNYNRVAGTSEEIATYSNVELNKGKKYVEKEIKNGHVLITIDQDGYIEKRIDENGREIQVDVEIADVIVADCVYNGKQQTPSIKVKVAGAEINPRDYDVVYGTNINVGNGSVTIKGKGNCIGTKTVEFKINALKLNGAAVSGIKAKTYTGKAITQTLVVKYGNKTLRKGIDYNVSYKNNKKIGNATIIISGAGGYTGTISKSFLINPKGTALSKVTATKKGFSVRWKKQATQTNGYQIQYSTNKYFRSGNKTITISKNKTVSRKITKLKAKKKYHIRIRTYKTVGGKKYCSNWSKIKTVSTK